VKLQDVYLDDLLSRLDNALGEQDGSELERTLSKAMQRAGTQSALVKAIQSAAHATPREDALPSLRQQLMSAKLGLSERPESTIEPAAPAAANEFCPVVPSNWGEMKLTTAAAEELVLKCLMGRGTASGREIADQIAVPFGLLNGLLNQLKTDRLVVHRGAAPLGDYLYQLSEGGQEAAVRYSAQCPYDGPAPVRLQDYVDSVHAQSIHKHVPSFQEISDCFADLVIDSEVLDQVGQAMFAGRGFFLYGASGNGKTSMAERVSRAFGKTIWIPRSLSIDGAIIRLFDPCNHVEVAPASKDGLYDQCKIDRRWVRIRRPTILAGGELTMDRLEIRSTAPGISEAPLQLKSNGGTLVIDDFGRQRMRPDELLNRWIVPLDRRIDYLNLPNGKTIQVPFEQLLVFSTNMRPQDLADEAFLRRVPYKIRALDPTQAQFKELLRRESDRVGITYNEAAVDHLIDKHYQGAGRPIRACHARDLLAQVKAYCEFKRLPLEMSPDRFESAVRNYFAMMD
jgi:predicted ATPase with chaperone activity